MTRKSQPIHERIVREKEQADQIRREENRQDQADILRLEGRSTAELHELAEAAWEDYRDKHLVLRAGDDEQARALEQAGNGKYLWSQQLFDAVDLARVLAVLWQRGETWAPKEPVFVARAE
jgi:hypothetical protein